MIDRIIDAVGALRVERYPGAAGPPALDAETERRWRYEVSVLPDDLGDPGSRDDQVGAGTRLYERLADWHLSPQRLWSGKGESIPYALQRTDPGLCARYCQSFGNLFTLGDVQTVIQVAEELLQGGGGPLFEGYTAVVPSTRRKPQEDKAV